MSDSRSWVGRLFHSKVQQQRITTVKTCSAAINVTETHYVLYCDEKYYTIYIRNLTIFTAVKQSFSELAVKT